MDFLTVLGGAITFGSGLGATLAGLFAYRQKSRVTLLEEMNNDYEKRVRQLEDERTSSNKRIDDLTGQVEDLQKQKALPLENLTALMVKQNQNVVKAITTLTKAINNQTVKGIR